MTRLLGALALLGAILLSVVLREATAPGHRAPNGNLEGGSAWLVDDPDAAYHLRRIEVAIAEGAVPLNDRYLNHPEGSAIPWPPAFDGLLARIAQMVHGSGGAPSSTRGVGEAELENMLVHAPVAMGALTTAAIFLATLMLAGRVAVGWRVAAAAVAAAIYASAPIAVWYGGVTRIDHHVFVALLTALALAAVGRCLESRERTEVMAMAMVGGLACGVALLSWLASALLVGACGGALALRALMADDEHRAAACRAGTLFFAVCAVTVMVPAEQSPWNAVQPGSLINLSSGVTLALLGAIAPFELILLAARFAKGPLPRWLAAAVGVVGPVLLLPGFLSGAREGFAWASRNNQFMDVVEESRPLLDPPQGPAWMGAVLDLGAASLLAPLALAAVVWLLVRAWRRPSHGLVLLVTLTAILGVLTLAQRRFGNSLIVPLAILLPLASVSWIGAVAAGWRRTVAVLGLAACVASCALSSYTILSVPAVEHTQLANWRAARLEGLRWMRTSTPEPGLWYRSEAPQAWGVLSVWGMGHLIEYHARRPTITTNFGSFVGEANFRAAAAALLEPADQAGPAVDALGAAYVVVGARMVGEFPFLGRTAGWSAPERSSLFTRTERGKTYSPRALQTLLWRMAIHDEQVGSGSIPGFELVWRTGLREGATGAPARPGELAGPALSIWRRAREAPGDHLQRATLKPR
ncbi:hypothetical protein [Engelhardtia mirabilis]|uniref:Oligosaccharyl transferase STT3 subunit n=1 Tax=Engelhardtia mirabilis TaxID=2528011 RepID=A0A518BNE4_9BACT|nr:Oligosaccharyl transferase STT3 subunit [Planctomycetes bacterium Pla133]QDV02820.1 Oligosaccharyl transferase STT3 subunit [Planctomycetes bacterium Pla86]